MIAHRILYSFIYNNSWNAILVYEQCTEYCTSNIRFVQVLLFYFEYVQFTECTNILVWYCRVFFMRFVHNYGYVYSYYIYIAVQILECIPFQHQNSIFNCYIKSVSIQYRECKNFSKIVNPKMFPPFPVFNLIYMTTVYCKLVHDLNLLILKYIIF